MAEEKRYDVGIYGLWYGNNYGSMITYYALSKIMEKMGKTYAMLRNPLGRQIDLNTLRRSHPLRFGFAHYDITDLYPLSRMKEHNKHFDAFLLGSDQMWNWYLSKPYGQSYFLDFVDDDKLKIAYATSFGQERYLGPAEDKEITKVNMKRMDAVSVRDDFSKRICEQDFDVPAELVMDPVFLCDRQNYDALIGESDFHIDEPFIFAYILDPNPEIGDTLRRAAEQTGLPIYVIFNEDDDKQRCKERLNVADEKIRYLEDAPLQEWLYMFCNASFVLTDSFHGTCFSVIFEKSFVVLKNSARGGQRFPYLLGTLGLMDYMVESPEQMLDKFNLLGVDHKIDYQSVRNRMTPQVDRSYRWLEDAINGRIRHEPLTVQESGEPPVPEKNYHSTVAAQLDMKRCTGCSSCSNVCPKEAIRMEEDKEGFLKPVIDTEKCVDCGLCAKKCIALHPQHTNFAEPLCYAMMADEETRMQSSSGGMFTVAAAYILENGGYVCGAAYGENMRVEHIIISDKADLPRLRGSKYMQSHPEKIYRSVKELLEKDNTVLFTGMPCQVAGLYAYLGKSYEKLYTMDLLCHGITSSSVFDKYHQEIHDGRPLKHVGFKEKKPWGWHAGVNAYFEDGNHYAEPLERDKYFVAYLSSISKSTACEVCPFNKLPRQGDLTIGDFWGIAKNDPEMFDNKGTSLVLVNNPKAQKFFETLKPRMAKWKEEPLQKAIPHNKIIQQPYPLHKNRGLFFDYFDDMDFAALTDGCKNNRLFDYWLADLDKKVPEEEREYYFLARAAAKHCGERQIVTWIRSPLFEKVLMKYFGKKVAFGVTMRKEAEKPGSIKSFYDIKNKSAQFYLVSLDRKYDAETYRLLADYGYKEFDDFVFYSHKPITLTNFDLSKGNYHDDYGNTIEGFSGVISQVVFKGNNSHIHLDRNVVGTANLTFVMGSNTKAYIGENTRFNNLCKIEMFGGTGSAEVIIGSGTRFRETEIRTFNYTETSSVRIGDKCTFESNFSVHANMGKKIIIGNDCMFSYNITLLSGDGHSIFDVLTGKNVNASTHSTPLKKQIVFGDHVWVGYNAFILNGTNVGSGSIVGSESLVKGVFPNNCAVGGNPAKMIKTDIAWSRQASDDIHTCGEEYVKRTMQSKPSITGLNVLVLGGTRFMGIQLVKKLIANGNNVTIATRGRKRDEFGSMVHRLTLDVTDGASVKKALEGKYFDVVFDNLAYCSANANNILSNVQCGRYIQLSSVAAYAPHFRLDMKESDFDPMQISPKICDYSAGYVTGKRQAEAYAYQKFPHIPVTTVRIPYVTPTDRLYYYCKNIVAGKPMAIKDVSTGFTFIRESEVGTFLPWIAAQNFTGPINLASKGYVTIQSILSYIEKKVGKTAVIDNEKGEQAPFETTFSMNLDKAERLGYHTSDLHEWFWKLLDQYIEKALKEVK